MAAFAGHRRRAEAEAEEKRHAMRRKQMSQKRKVLKLRTGEKFEKLSEDGMWLMESQIEELLALAMMKKQHRLEPDAVQLVVDTARRSQEKDGLDPPSHLEGAMAKKHLVKAVEKYGEFIQKSERIDEVFQKFDKNKDGYLSKKELTKMLQDYERKCNRSKNGIAIQLMVAPDDVDWIIEESDSDNTGTIDQAEYLPAIAAWEELAQMKLEDSEKCVIM